MNFWITVKTLNERGKKKKKKCTMQNWSDTWQDLMHSRIWSLLLYIYIDIYIYIYIGFNNVTVFYKCFYFLFLLILE